MRTKTLLIAAAALSASVLASSAQVYSANVVGYVNTPIPASGYVLAANPLVGSPNNSIGTVIPAAPRDLVILLWNSSNSYDEYDYFADNAPGERWFGVTESAFVDTTLQLPPGMGFFIKSGGTETNLTFVGEVKQSPPSLNTTLDGGRMNLVASQPPVAGNLTTLGLTADVVLGTKVLTWKVTVPQGYLEYELIDNGGTPTWFGSDEGDFAEPTIGVGEGFFVDNKSSTKIWSVDFTVGP